MKKPLCRHLKSPLNLITNLDGDKIKTIRSLYSVQLFVRITSRQYYGSPLKSYLKSLLNLKTNLDRGWINTIRVVVLGATIYHVLQVWLHCLTITFLSIDDDCHGLSHVYELIVQIDT